MSDKFQDKYRISSARLHNWDYSWNAIYFVTINVYDREEILGEITNSKIHLSNLGIIANVFWYEIKNHFPFVDIDAFQVMPNHIHGILAINNPENFLRNKKEKQNEKTGYALSQEDNKAPGDKRFQNPGKKSLSTIIGSYKSAVSKHAHRLGYEFKWKDRFHDSIIRDEIGLRNVRKYIENNVSNWGEDEFNSMMS